MAFDQAEPDLITSPANALVKQTRQLATRRRARHRDGLFLVEGERTITTVLESNTSIHTAIIDNERRGDISPALVASLQSSAARIVTMSSELFHSIADTEHPQAVMAIAHLPEMTFPANPTVVVALDAVRDPGNLGTIIRTAAAAGVDGIALLPGCVDPFHPGVVRASAGTVATLPTVQFASILDLLEQHFARVEAVNVAASDASGELDYRDANWLDPVILVAGSEAHGLGSESLASTTSLVRIPMAEGVESLNVSVATGVLLFHIRAVRSGR